MSAPSLKVGLDVQRSGNLADAEAIYGAILAQRPHDGLARTLLGLAQCAGDRFDDGIQTIREAIENAGDDFPQIRAFSLFSLGQALAGHARMAEAAEAFRHSIALQPGVLAAYTGLGQALAEMGDYAGAAAALREALAVDPADPEPYVCTGKLLHRIGRPQDALAHFQTAIELAPARPGPWFGLGSALLALGRVDDAAAALCQAVALDPDCPLAHLQLGDARQRQGDHLAASVCYRRAIALSPASPDAHCRLSNALYDRGLFEDAAAAAEAAIALKSDLADAHSNRGNALLALLRFEEAEAAYRAAIRLTPTSAAYLSNLGSALTAQRKLDEALEAQRQAIALDPDFADAKYNHAISLLLDGQFEPGWRYYETRWQLPWNPPRGFSQPQWGGEALEGRTILLHAEQGLGDMLQMARYVPLVAERGGRVLLEVHPPLVRLLRSLPGAAQILPLGATLPPFDLHCPLFSLPFVFGTRADTIPAGRYLKADPLLAAPGLIARCRQVFRSHTGLRVGLVWRGAERIGAHVNRERSIAPEQLAPLARIPGVDLYSLQIDQDVASRRTAAALGMIDLMSGVVDFADTGALVTQLDLVISVDTAVVHLAAGMGKPVWLLSRYSGCWRWLMERTDSPWYPSLRIYRQQRPQDWSTVIAEVAADLLRAVATGQFVA